MNLKTSFVCLFVLAISNISFAGDKATSAQCEAYARKVMDAALDMNTANVFFLDNVSTTVEFSDESGQNINVETLSFATEAAYVVVKTLPNYYGDGKCQLADMSISRN